METRAHTQTCPPRRVLALLALLLALLVVAAGLAAGAAARPEHAGHASCATSRHARHAAAKRCAKHHTRKGTHKNRKPAPRTAAPAPALTPARCEDASAPVRAASGTYTCEDGSEPACSDGSDPIRPSASSAPMCRVSKEGAGHECTQGQSGECGVEIACEEEVTEGPQGCEHGSAFEEEELEA